MQINTHHFGIMEVDEDKIITFKEGLPGFEQLKQYTLIESAESKFCYLQSIEDGDICFVILDPSMIMKDYNPMISENYFEKLGGGADDEFALYNIVCLRNPIGESTINLAGPLLIHVAKRLGVQVITEDNTYSTKQKIADILKERR